MSLDNNVDKCRLKLKYPEGLEFEIEGPKEFIIEQKKDILSEMLLISKEKQKEQEKIDDSLKKIIDFKNNIPYIKIRLNDLDTKMAILTLLAIYKISQKTNSVSAIQLSKSLKLSGYQPKRIDREITPLIKDKTVIAMGSKRKREYSMTEKGMTKATIKIFNISQNIKNK